MPKYKRISLKLSGEALGGADVIDFKRAQAVAREIKLLHEAGVEVGVTLGGGNIWRGRSSGAMDRNRADQMGMLATVINSLAMESVLLEAGVPCKVLSETPMERVCDAFTAGRAKEAFAAGQVAIFAAGTGHPFFSTDTAAALKAAQIGADALLLAKNVDGVYSADPKADACAVRYERLSYDDVIARDLQAADITAITLCRERRIPILVFAVCEEGALLRAASGGDVGTLID